jgi:hypothetical protein
MTPTPPTVPPTADELLKDVRVQEALDQAWSDSLPADPAQRHEEGLSGGPGYPP